MDLEYYEIESDFREGDIVVWKNYEHHLTDIIIFARTNNLFKIEKIDGDKVKLEYVDVEVIINELEAVEIGSEDDKPIYWDPIIAASVVLPGQPIPVHHKNYDYYLPCLDYAFKDDYDNPSFSERLKEEGITKVHELQHFLSSLFCGGDRLEINH